MRRILSVLLENESGALSRVVGLFSQRGYNIESLNVAPTDDHSLSRLTVTTTGDDLKIEQITKHLNKIIDVVKVVDLTEGAHVERDTLLLGDETTLYADAAYSSKETRDKLERFGIADQVQRKGYPLAGRALHAREAQQPSVGGGQ